MTEGSDNEPEEPQPPPAAERSSSGFHSFAPKVKGVLYKISPLSEALSQSVERYIREGFMKRDITYVTVLYGLVAPSQTKDFSMFWESPWVEEQIKEAGKKRKIEQQQRTLAVRSFIKASTQEDSVDVERFLDKVDKLTEWDRHDESTTRESIRTVSRMVQSFEKRAVLSLITLLRNGTVRNPAAEMHLNRLRGSPQGDLDPITHALRRAPYTYTAFASLVSAELLLSEATNGSKNVSINMSRRLDMEKFNSVNTMLDILQRATVASLPADSIGLPLMDTSCNVCISKGVLVVAGKRATQATYILDIENLDEVMEARKHKRKKGLDIVEITAQVIEEEKEEPPQAPPKKKGTKKAASASLASLVS